MNYGYAHREHSHLLFKSLLFFLITATAAVPAVTPVINSCVASAAVILAVNTAGIANTIFLSPYLNHPMQ